MSENRGSFNVQGEIKGVLYRYHIHRRHPICCHDDDSSRLGFIDGAIVYSDALQGKSPMGV